MKKKILLTLAAVAAVAVGVVGMSAFEAHVINVTAHIENALAVDPYGIDFGTVFPQEYITSKTFDVELSRSFQDANRVDDVAYKIVQKDKPWTLNFGGNDVDAHNRSLLFVDPDHVNSSAIESGGQLIITTDNNNVEDLFGANETFGDVTAPRMVIPMGGNFTIETKVTADPQNYYQAGGILVYGSDGNVVRLELTNWSGGGNAVYMESQENGVKVGKRWTASNMGDTVYLKLTRNGDKFTGYYSADGSSWTEVPYAEGENPIVNGNIGGHPKVGLSAISADPQNPMAFSAYFDYVTFNGDYLSLCRFLSKTTSDESGDVSHPSYYVDGSCARANDRPEASGVLSKYNQDIKDTWTVDLKVPPISGYVGQDWPADCAEWVVEEDEMDYGCDLWVEVTRISPKQ